MKKETIKINSREDAEAAMERLAAATHKRDKKLAQMNQELTEVRARFEDDITRHSEDIVAAGKALNKWSDKNPDLFGNLRSLKMTHGIIGYRTNPPAVRTISGISMDRAIAFVKERLPKFIRSTDTIDKEAILAARATLSGAELATVGLRIEQGEKFYAEPEKDEVGK